jgi:hypothetical protein
MIPRIKLNAIIAILEIPTLEISFRNELIASQDKLLLPEFLLLYNWLAHL